MPNELIAGLDPLPPSDEPHPFQFVKGVAEFLPWPDDSFQSVVIGTSLDHVLLLDHCFSEMQRVLEPGGLFLNWVSFIKGSKKYDPYSADVGPVDAFHLFHFDRDWYEEWVGRYFTLVELLDLEGGSFYAWRRD